jgi:hypothetical protein
MTALTKARDTVASHFDYPISLAQKGAVKIWNGALVNVDANGLAVPAADVVGHRCRGRANATIDSAGLADAAVSVEVLVGIVTVNNPAGTNQLTRADLGNYAYVVDDNTVARAAGTLNAVAAGILIAVDTTGATATIDQRLARPQITGSNVAPVADNAVTPAISTGTAEQVFPFLLPDAADTDYDFVMPYKAEVIDATVIKDGAGAANTLTLKNGAGTAISDAIASAVDKAVTRAGTLDKTTRVLAANAVLRLSNHRAAGTAALAAFVKVIRRP